MKKREKRLFLNENVKPEYRHSLPFYLLVRGTGISFVIVFELFFCFKSDILSEYVWISLIQSKDHFFPYHIMKKLCSDWLIKCLTWAYESWHNKWKFVYRYIGSHHIFVFFVDLWRAKQWERCIFLSLKVCNKSPTTYFMHFNLLISRNPLLGGKKTQHLFPCLK